MRVVHFFVHVVLAGLLAATSLAHAATTDDACPAGNLLAGAAPLEVYDAYHARRITDGVIALEGDPWMSDVTSLLTVAGRVTWDLGRPTPVRHLLLQADGDDAYHVSVSLDGNDWRSLWVAPPEAGPGMRLRLLDDVEATIRFLRVTVARGNGAHSVAEFAAYCRRPDPWPPRFSVESGVVRDAAWSAARKKHVALGKIAVAVLGALALAFVLRSGARARRLGRVLCFAVIAAGALAWTNFGTFHDAGVLHDHEIYHYVLGSKYFAENRYTRLYDCTEQAEADDGRRAFVERRTLRNLATNRLGPATRIFADPEACRDAFDAARWREFRRDVEFYRGRSYPGAWSLNFLDHGYNATPVWTMIGGRLANIGSLSRQPAILALVDVLLYIGIFALIAWAFGLESCALAALIWGCGFPWEYFWSGGAFARTPWLFMAVAGLCLLKKKLPGLAGFAFGWSVLLRIFPLALALGPALFAVREAIAGRALAPEHRRMLVGSALAVAILVPLSLTGATGPTSWSEFVDNSIKHASSPSGNLMGLRSLFAYHPERTQAALVDGSLEDYGRWEEARRETFREREVFYWIVAAALVALSGWFAFRGARATWEAVAVGGLVVLALFELSCYYQILLILLVPLAAGRLRGLALLVAAVVLSQIVPLSGVSLDTRYALQSLIFLAASTGLIVDTVVARRRA